MCWQSVMDVSMSGLCKQDNAFDWSTIQRMRPMDTPLSPWPSILTTVCRYVLNPTTCSQSRIDLVHFSCVLDKAMVISTSGTTKMEFSFMSVSLPLSPHSSSSTFCSIRQTIELDVEIVQLHSISNETLYVFGKSAKNGESLVYALSTSTVSIVYSQFILSVASIRFVIIRCRDFCRINYLVHRHRSRSITK